MYNSITCDNECNKVCKIQEYLDIKNCSGKERLILNQYQNVKMTLQLKLITTETVPSIGSYYYYTRDWVKKNKRHVNIK